MAEDVFTIKLPISIMNDLDDYSQKYIDEYRNSKVDRPPLSHMEWLALTPEGKKFTHDCMQLKYIKMDQRALTKLSYKMYYDTYGMRQTKGYAITRNLPINEARNMAVLDIVTQALKSKNNNVLNLFGTVKK